MSILRKWNGPKVVANVVNAAKEAIDETTAAAAEEAKSSHGYQTRSGVLEEETISEPAEVKGHRITGRFGTTQRRGFYGLFKEYEEPFLRPAADREFPELAGRIAEKTDA